MKPWPCFLIGSTLTVFGLAGTQFFLGGTVHSKKPTDQQPLAYAIEPAKEIYVRASGRQIWNPLLDLQGLTHGDSIKTGTKGQVKLQVADSHQSFFVETESHLNIERSQMDLLLELTDGSIYIESIKANSGTSANPEKPTIDSSGIVRKILLHVAQGNLDLSRTSARIQKIGSSEWVLQVFQGSILLGDQVIASPTNEEAQGQGLFVSVSASGIKKIDTGITIRSPNLSEIYFVNPNNLQSVALDVTGIPANALVTIESGPTRKQMNPVIFTKTNTGRLMVQWPVGKHFWQVKALDPADYRKVLAQSGLQTILIAPRFPPTPIMPEDGREIQTRKSVENLTLRWSTEPDYVKVLVELFKILDSSHIEGSPREPLMTKEFGTETDSTDLNLGLGTYEWRLTSYFKGTAGAFLHGPLHLFKIVPKNLNMIKIVWSPKIEDIQHFLNKDPKISLQWDADQPNRVKSWKLKLVPEGGELSRTPATETHTSTFQKNLDKPGRYLASVEAFDEEGEFIGRSQPRNIAVVQLPLLRAPEIFPRGVEELIAKSDGTYLMQWQDVTDSAKYEVVVRNKQEQVVIEESVTSPQASLKSLMPGRYTVAVRAVDAYGRHSEGLRQRYLVVPNKSEVAAPKLKKLRITQ